MKILRKLILIKDNIFIKPNKVNFFKINYLLKL